MLAIHSACDIGTWPLLRRAAIGAAATLGLTTAVALLPRHRFSVAFLLMAGIVYLGLLASQTRGRVRDALLLFAALLVVPAVAEAIFAALASALAPGVHYSAPLNDGHPILGYAPLPSNTAKAVKVGADGRTIFNVTYTIDEHGLRRTDSNPDGPTIAFFFDSITFGEGIEDSEALPQQFANLTAGTYHVVNLGVPGYGPQAMLRTLETGFRDDLLSRPVFFIAQTAAWHAERAACRPEYVWHTPRYVLVGGQAVFQGRCAQGFELWGLRKLNESYLYRQVIRPLLVDRQRDLDLYLAELRGAVLLAAHKYGAQTMILYYRAESDQFAGTTYTDEKIIETLRQSGAIVLDLARAEEGIGGLAIPGDGHPTAKAHRLRASLIRDEIAKVEAIKQDRH
jgi:hypothetical protein